MKKLHIYIFKIRTVDIEPRARNAIKLIYTHIHFDRFVSRLISRPNEKNKKTEIRTHQNDMMRFRSFRLPFLFSAYLHRYMHVIVITSDDILLSFAVDGLTSNSWFSAKKVKVYQFALSGDYLYIAFVPHAHPTEYIDETLRVYTFIRSWSLHSSAIQ